MNEVMRVSLNCGVCGYQHVLGIPGDPSTTTFGELEELVHERLGGGEYICPRCDGVAFVEFGNAALRDPERRARYELARRIEKNARGVRFGVGQPDGPRSAVWRVWTNNRRDDVYIAARGLARDLKVSLHPNYWYYGFTEHYVQRGGQLVAPGTDRKKSVFERPPEFTPGWTRAFVIIVPASEVVDGPGAYEGSEAVWLPRPPEREAYHFTVLLSKPDPHRGRRGFPSADGYAHVTELIMRLDLTTGERFWVIAHHQPLDPGIVAQMAQAHEMLRRVAEAAQEPNYHARMIAFGDQTDGARSFLDLSAFAPA